MKHLGLPHSEADVFRRLVDNFPGFAWIVSLEPQSPRLLYASPAAQPLWEWCRINLQEDFRHLVRIIHPEDLAGLTALWSQLLEGEQVSGEFRILGPKGEVHEVTGRAFPLEAENSPPRLVAGFCEAAATSPPRQPDEATLA